MGINRIRLANGSPLEMAKAQQTAASDPALDAIRQKLFGQNYIQDIGKGQGIAQYYSNFGTPSSLQFTQPAVSTPVVDTSAPVVDTGGGGGGQAITPTTSITDGTNINTPEDQRLIDAGIGVQLSPGQPVVAPGEIPYTQDVFDEFNRRPVNTDFRNQQLVNQGIGVRVEDKGPVFAPGEAPVTQAEMDEFNQEQQGTIQNIIGKAGQTVSGALTQLGKIPGAVVDAANQTVDVFGKKLNVGKTLAGLAINKIAGVPATLVFDLLKDVIPERDPRQNELDRFYDVKDGTIQSGLMKGYNPVSGGGLYTLSGGAKGKPPTYGLQEAYDDRIGNITKTLMNPDSYGLTKAEIDQIKAGNITDAIKAKAINPAMSKTYGKPTVTNLVQDLTDLVNLKAREKDVLDAAITGAPQENIGATDSIYSAPDTLVGPNIDEEAGRFGDEADTPSVSSVNEAEAREAFRIAQQREADQAFRNRAADQIDEFGTAPGTETVLGKPGIGLFDDAETGIELDTTDPSNRQTIIDRAKSAGVGNVEQHITNNSKLARARDEGLISGEDYNILGGYDVTQNLTAGNTFAGGALNMFGSPVYNVGQGLFDMTGETEQIANYNEDGTISYTATPTSKQRLEDIPGTVARNTIGGAGLISQDKKNIHNAIINGDPYTDEGVAAIKNQIEMSRYQDPIMGMVNQNILADDTINRMTDDVDLDLFNTTPQDIPTSTFNADTFDDDVSFDIFNDFDDFDDGTMTGFAADSMDDVLGPMPAPPTPSVPDFISGSARDDKPTGPPSTGFKAPTKQGQSPRGSTTGGGGGGRDSCFLPDTLVTMADGSTKKIIDVDIGDEVAEGGKVFATGKFLNNELYDYKGVKVSGSHMVNEDGVWMRIRDTKHGKPLGDDEHTVYVFGSENRRILINNILFTDYFETKEQEKLIDNEKDFFNNWKTYGNKIDQDNINILNAS